MAGMLGYGMVWLAIASGAGDEVLRGGLACFTVGALVGVFGRLYAEFGNDTAVDDFGLSAMRQIAAPMLSGIAAVVGVGLAVHVAAPISQVPGPLIPDPFNLSTNATSLVTAAVFGLTPGLLIDRLRQQSDRFKTNLRSTEPQSGHTTEI
jgi:hypothetical protein